MGNKDAGQEVEAFEAALEFIAQYELSGDERSDTDSDDFCADGAARHVRRAKDLTARFQFHRAHSLEPPSDPFGSTDVNAADGATADVLESLFEPIIDVHALSAPPTQDAVDQDDDAGQLSETAASSSAPSSPDLGHPVRPGGVADGRRLDAATARLLKIARPQKAQSISRRQELQDLRETVKDLTKQLESLQATSASPTAEASDYVCSILSQSESVWEQFAARQLAARRNAEEENQRLWAVVDQQVRYAKNLKRKLRRQARDNVSAIPLQTVCDVLPSLRVRLYRLPPLQELGRVLTLKRFKPLTALESEGVLAGLERNMDELYVGVDKQFTDAEMHTLPCPGRKRQARRDTVSGIFIELLDSNPVPFELRTTEKAVWTSLGERGLQYRHGRSLMCKVSFPDLQLMLSGHRWLNSFWFVKRRRTARRTARSWLATSLTCKR